MQIFFLFCVCVRVHFTDSQMNWIDARGNKELEKYDKNAGKKLSDKNKIKQYMDISRMHRHWLRSQHVPFWPK